MTLRAFKRIKLANSIHVVRDGEEALDFLFSPAGDDREFATPKLILLDLKLPKVSGLEVLQKIKADARTRQIPVVALTTSNAERDIQESYRLGINSYIVKPLDFNQFAEAIQQIGLYWLLETTSGSDLNIKQ